MRISKTSLWLSVIDALLVLLASVATIFLKSIYVREPSSGAVQAIGQDIVNLVAHGNRDPLYLSCHEQ